MKGAFAKSAISKTRLDSMKIVNKFCSHTQSGASQFNTDYVKTKLPFEAPFLLKQNVSCGTLLLTYAYLVFLLFSSYFVLQYNLHNHYCYYYSNMN